ncbi:MAG: glycosyltransferase family 1 protein, partial [bacterium]
MKLLCLTKYTRRGPSSRYRVYQFLPYLERAGIDIDIQTLHDDSYLQRIFSGKRPSLPYLLRRASKRTWALLRARRYDLVLIQKELFPRAPDIFETFLRWTGVDFVFDFDDAIFVLYEDMRSPLTGALLKNKIPRVIARSRLVLAGNEFLADYARRYSQRVVRFPTVVDTDRFSPGERARTPGKPVVGWMGSPETVGFIEDIREPLEDLGRKMVFELRLVGADPVRVDGVAVTSRPWNEADEVEELRQFDVGIMPLPMSRWA